MYTYIHVHIYREAQAKNELIARLQAQLELSARVAANLTSDNHAAVKQIETLTDKIGTQETEISRLNGLVLGTFSLHVYCVFECFVTMCGTLGVSGW
jgi:hypothetical protein